MRYVILGLVLGLSLLFAYENRREIGAEIVSHMHFVPVSGQ